MSGFEIAGVALAGPAVVQQLIKVSIEGYRIFQDTKLVGKEYQQLKHELDIQQERYLDWLRSLSACGGDLSNVFDPKSRRYELVLTTLAMIAGVFAEVDQLNRRYGITQVVPEESSDVVVVGEAKSPVKSERQGFRKFLNIGKSAFGKSRKETPKNDRRQLAQGQSFERFKPTEVKESRKTDFGLVLKQELLPSVSTTECGATDLENYLRSLQENDLKVQVPGLERRATELAMAAEKYQQALPTYRKYLWKFDSKERLESFVGDLTKYITYLEVLTNNHFKQSGLIAIALPVSFQEFNVPIDLPFSQLRTFCGREGILDDIVQNLRPEELKNDPQGRQIVVLHGMSGLGKSQIALEYAYRYARYYSMTLWVDVTDWTTIHNSCSQIVASVIAHYAVKYISKPENMFAAIAIDLKIPGQIDNTGQLIGNAQKSPWKVVRNWLARKENSRWLLIADGLNDEEDTEKLQEVLPAGSHGHIVVTSRVTVPDCKILDIPVMDKDSGVRLLLGEKFDTVSEKVKETVNKIVDILGNLPLAIAQAAAYISMRRIDYIRYLERLMKDLVGLIGQVIPGYKNGVFSGWRLSVQALRKHHPDCVPLLRLCSFLSPDGVSEELLHRGIGAMDWLQNDQNRLEDAIDHLVEYGLAKRLLVTSSGSKPVESIWIHHLVQRWARNAIYDNELAMNEVDQDRLQILHKNGARDAIRMVGWGIKGEDVVLKPREWIYERENWAHLVLCCKEYIPKYRFEDGSTKDGKLGWAMRNLGSWKYRWNEYQDSLDLAKRAVKILEMAVAEDASWEERFLMAKQEEAEQYVLSRDYSIDLYASISEIGNRQEALLGKDHPSRLFTGALLGYYLKTIGRTTEARDLLLKYFARMEAVMKEEDLIYTVTIGHLASVYMELGEFDKALEGYVRSYELHKRHHGMNTQETILRLGNLAWCKSRLGDLEGSCECYREVASAAEATYGLANKETIQYLQDLRYMSLRLDRKEDASSIQEKIDRAKILQSAQEEG